MFLKNHKFWALHSKTAIQIASSTTSYARIVMHKYKMMCKNVYYSDTDSIFTDEKLPQELISNDIGKFKLVYQIKEGIFISLKTYWLSLNTGQEITKFKGETKEKNFTKYELKMALSERNIISTSIFGFSVNFKTLTINRNKRDFLILNRYVKREKIYDKNNIWVDTHPHKLPE
jgi:hypothetical protein